VGVTPNANQVPPPTRAQPGCTHLRAFECGEHAGGNTAQIPDLWPLANRHCRSTTTQPVSDPPISLHDVSVHPQSRTASPRQGDLLLQPDLRSGPTLENALCWRCVLNTSAFDRASNVGHRRNNSVGRNDTALTIPIPHCRSKFHSLVVGPQG